MREQLFVLITFPVVPLRHTGWIGTRLVRPVFHDINAVEYRSQAIPAVEDWDCDYPGRYPLTDHQVKRTFAY